LLNRIKFEKYIVGSTIPHIYFKDYSSERVQVPCLAEQNKIAEFLSSIDNKIEQTNQQLTATKQFKKALLQQMFV
jgi:type I restriction enzyme S subunit